MRNCDSVQSWASTSSFRGDPFLVLFIICSVGPFSSFFLSCVHRFSNMLSICVSILAQYERHLGILLTIIFKASETSKHSNAMQTLVGAPLELWGVRGNTVHPWIGAHLDLYSRWINSPRPWQRQHGGYNHPRGFGNVLSVYGKDVSCTWPMPPKTWAAATPVLAKLAFCHAHVSIAHASQLRLSLLHEK